MAKERILAIDDEQTNLFLIRDFLADEPLHVDTEASPAAAWERLSASDSRYALVLLDRTMPGLDGLDFLRRMKSDPRLADIPVIMQTAAAAPEQVREGLQAGAHYYLVKPYESEALVAIVRSALDDRRAHMALQHLARRLEEAQRLMVAAEYRFASLDDINALVPVLAALAPDKGKVAAGLADLMLNAVEHGNLGITYVEKARLKREGGWEAEIERRLALPEYRGRFATVGVERQAGILRFTITDQGDGFDWRRFLDFDPARAFDANGRGIAMARKMSFSALEFRGKGNVVVASVAI